MEGEEYAVAIGEQLGKTINRLESTLGVVVRLQTLVGALDDRIATLERQVNAELRRSIAAREGRLVR